jgi:hypothetical protein
VDQVSSFTIVTWDDSVPVPNLATGTRLFEEMGALTVTVRVVPLLAVSGLGVIVSV